MNWHDDHHHFLESVRYFFVVEAWKRLSSWGFQQITVMKLDNNKKKIDCTVLPTTLNAQVKIVAIKCTRKIKLKKGYLKFS